MSQSRTCISMHMLLVVSIACFGCGNQDSKAVTAKPGAETQNAVPTESDLESRVRQAQTANREKLPARAKLVWKQISDREYDSQGMRTLTLHGHYEMWWDGEKIATRNMSEVLTQSPDGSSAVEKHGFCTAFDGDEFRRVPNETNPENVSTKREPEYRRDENWLHIIKWNQTALERAKKEGLLYSWTETIRDNRPHAVRSVCNAEGTLLEEKYFDLEQGGEYVGHAWFDQQGRCYSQSAIELKEITTGFWFPITLEETSLDPKSGKRTARIRYEINEDKSQFAKEAQVPPAYFDELPPPTTEFLRSAASTWTIVYVGSYFATAFATGAGWMDSETRSQIVWTVHWPISKLAVNEPFSGPRVINNANGWFFTIGWNWLRR